MANLPIPQAQSSADERTTDLRAFYAELGLRDIARARAKFESFVHKVGYTNCGKSFKSDTYVESVNGKIVTTYLMSPALAATFAAWVEPARGFAMVSASVAQPVDAIHHDLMFRISIPERWVVEIIGRKQSSVRATLKVIRTRAVGTPLEKHFELRGNEYWYTPWFLANAPFTKQDGMVFKGVLTGLAETLGLTQEMQKYLPGQGVRCVPRLTAAVVRCRWLSVEPVITSRRSSCPPAWVNWQVPDSKKPGG